MVALVEECFRVTGQEGSHSSEVRQALTEVKQDLITRILNDMEWQRQMRIS